MKRKMIQKAERKIQFQGKLASVACQASCYYYIDCEWLSRLDGQQWSNSRGQDIITFEAL